MRTRSKVNYGSCITVPLDAFYYKSANYTGKTVYNYPRELYVQEPDIVSEFEAASDLGDRSTRRTWNDFEHYKCVVDDMQEKRDFTLASAFSLPSSTYYRPFTYRGGRLFLNSSWFGSLSRPIDGLPVLYDDSLSDGHFVRLSPGFNQLSQHALQVMLPKLKEELSLVNTVVELKDFKSVPRTYARMSQLAKRGKKTIRQILGATSDGYLQSQFNLLPLFSDIVGISNALVGVKSQLRKLLILEGKVLKRHYTVSMGPEYRYSHDETLGKSAYLNGLQVSTTGCGISPRDPKIQGLTYAERDVYYQYSTFHAEIQYRFLFSRYQREMQNVLALLDVFGVNFNPSIIWNAIPWSFVIDWVAGVNRWLDQFKVQNMEPMIVIYKYLASERVSRTTYINVNFHVGSTAKLPRTRYNALRCQENSYRRVSGVPQVAEALAVSGISLKEISLASALVLSRKRRGFSHG
jgi:hypothetical protein